MMIYTTIDMETEQRFEKVSFSLFKQISNIIKNKNCQMSTNIYKNRQISSHSYILVYNTNYLPAIKLSTAESSD